MAAGGSELFPTQGAGRRCSVSAFHAECTPEGLSLEEAFYVFHVGCPNKILFEETVAAFKKLTLGSFSCSCSL